MSKIEEPAANGGPADTPSYVKRHHRRRPSKKLMRSVPPSFFGLPKKTSSGVRPP